MSRPLSTAFVVLAILFGAQSLVAQAPREDWSSLEYLKPDTTLIDDVEPTQRRSLTPASARFQVVCARDQVILVDSAGGDTWMLVRQSAAEDSGWVWRPIPREPPRRR
jgi:hypothetical protein